MDHELITCIVCGAKMFGGVFINGAGPYCPRCMPQTRTCPYIDTCPYMNPSPVSSITITADGEVQRDNKEDG